MVPGSLGCGASVLAAITMLAPSRAARNAIAKPMPRLAPETNMVLPASVGMPVHYIARLLRRCRKGDGQQRLRIHDFDLELISGLERTRRILTDVGHQLNLAGVP